MKTLSLDSALDLINRTIGEELIINDSLHFGLGSLYVWADDNIPVPFSTKGAFKHIDYCDIEPVLEYLIARDGFLWV